MLAFESPAGALYEALQIVSKAVASRDLIPALTGIHVEAKGTSLVLMATDLELGIRTSLPVKVSSEGEALFPARSLLELLRRINPADTVEFKAIDGRTTIRFGKSRFDLPTFPVQDFPKLTFGGEGEPVTVPADAMQKTIARVAYASAQREDSLPVLLGIKLSFLQDGTLEACASDNFRLAWSQVKAGEPSSPADVVVRAKALSELVRLVGEAATEIRVGERQLFVNSGSIEAFCQLVEGQFPDHRKLVRESYETVVRFEVADLLQACERANLVSDHRSPQIIIQTGETGLQISSGSAETGDSFEEIEAEVEGAPLEITFNPKYLVDALRNAGFERAEIGFNGALSAARLRPAGSDEQLALILPIRRM